MKEEVVARESYWLTKDFYFFSIFKMDDIGTL